MHQAKGDRFVRANELPVRQWVPYRRIALDWFSPFNSLSAYYMRNGSRALLTRGTNLPEASGDSFEIGDGRILICSSIGVQNSIF